MQLLRYQDVICKPDLFLAITGHTEAEFKKILGPFSLAWREANRGKKLGEGRPAILNSDEDRLFFILFYCKTYPLQELLGYLFGMSQERASEYVAILTGVLQTALQAAGYAPERVPEELKKKLEGETVQDYGIDGTDRKIQRPANQEKQELYYSGKRKTHAVKNLIIAGMEDRKVKYLGKTHEGKKHDKRALDEESPTLPDDTCLMGDTGFQGYESEGVQLVIPFKKPRGGELTEQDKMTNKMISSYRVIVEHVISGIKRLRILKEIFRGTKEILRDTFMEIACGLHNLRVESRSAVHAVN